MQKITPFLWFDANAEEAVNFYVSLFKDSRVVGTTRYGDAGPGPKGHVMTIDFELRGQRFVALNGGPQFKFTPAVSLFIHCAREEIDALFEKLSAGGEVMMPLEKYPFSERYAFLKDRFGVSWQLMLSVERHIAPCLLFVGKDLGRAEAAVQHYTAIFRDARIDHLMRYEEGQGGKAGTVAHASFLLHGQEFMAMDGEGPHAFSFNEALSFVVNCASQEEVDYFWNRLSEGGEPGRCGWLKDRFGISWQVVPTVLNKLVQDKDHAKAQRVVAAMLQMDKLDIARLEQAAKA